jgi:hypothetical protein
MTATARAYDMVMAQEGWDPNEPEYYDELERRMREAFPQKLGQPAKRQVQPTVQNRGSDGGGSGKVRVVITQADKDAAARMGISVEAYARQKVRMEAAQKTASGYTEIL